MLPFYEDFLVAAITHTVTASVGAASFSSLLGGGPHPLHPDCPGIRTKLR
jgi:hypothetical protein